MQVAGATTSPWHVAGLLKLITIFHGIHFFSRNDNSGFFYARVLALWPFFHSINFRVDLFAASRCLCLQTAKSQAEERSPCGLN